MTTIRRVALLAPMRSELAPFVKRVPLTRDDGDRYHRGVIGHVEVVATITGIGTRPAIEATERILEAHEVDHVVISGIAGGVPDAVSVGDLLVPEVVVDVDTGREYRPTTFGDETPRGRIETSDEFAVTDDDIAALVDRGVHAVDMETASIAAVCDARGVPWVAYRSISDMAGVTPDWVLGMASPDGGANVGAIIRTLGPRPWRLRGLAKLAKDSTRAASTAADAAIAGVRGLGPTT